MECAYCGEPHGPRTRCSDVQARIDGVTVGKPEGNGGLACWAGPSPRPLVAIELGEAPEWVLR